MAGSHGAGAEMQFTGIEKYINSYTPRGKLYGAYSSMVIWTGVFLTFKFWPRKSKTIEEAPKQSK